MSKWDDGYGIILRNVMCSAPIIMECRWRRSKELSFSLSASPPECAAEGSGSPDSVFADGGMNGMNHGVVNQGRG